MTSALSQCGSYLFRQVQELEAEKRLSHKLRCLINPKIVSSDNKLEYQLGRQTFSEILRGYENIPMLPGSKVGLSIYIFIFQVNVRVIYSALPK